MVVLERLLMHDRQGSRLAGVQRGRKGKRWTDNLVVWPAAASGSCVEMIAQSPHQTSSLARPQATACTDTEHSVWARRQTICCEVLCVVQHCATTPLHQSL